MTEEGFARLCNGTCPNPLSFNTWACTQVDISMHVHTDAQTSSVQRAAIQLLNHKQMGSTA